MQKTQRRIDGQSHTGNGGSRAQPLGTLHLMQLFGQIMETMQNRVIADLVADYDCLHAKHSELRDEHKTQGDPGLPSCLGRRWWEQRLARAIITIADAVHQHTPESALWTKANTWDAIWEMFPEDTGGILACTQENIHSEVLRPCDIPDLGMHLPKTFFSAAVIPIIWDFDNRTFDFLGNDSTQQSLAQLHKAIRTNNPTATRTWNIPIFHLYSFKMLTEWPMEPRYSVRYPLC